MMVLPHLLSGLALVKIGCARRTYPFLPLLLLCRDPRFHLPLCLFPSPSVSLPRWGKPIPRRPGVLIRPREMPNGTFLPLRQSLDDNGQQPRNCPKRKLLLSRDAYSHRTASLIPLSVAAGRATLTSPLSHTTSFPLLLAPSGAADFLATPFVLDGVVGVAPPVAAANRAINPLWRWSVSVAVAVAAAAAAAAEDPSVLVVSPRSCSRGERLGIAGRVLSPRRPRRRRRRPAAIDCRRPRDETNGLDVFPDKDMLFCLGKKKEEKQQRKMRDRTRVVGSRKEAMKIAVLSGDRGE